MHTVHTGGAGMGPSEHLAKTGVGQGKSYGGVCGGRRKEFDDQGNVYE